MSSSGARTGGSASAGAAQRPTTATTTTTTTTTTPAQSQSQSSPSSAAAHAPPRSVSSQIRNPVYQGAASSSSLSLDQRSATLDSTSSSSSLLPSASHSINAAGAAAAPGRARNTTSAWESDDIELGAIPNAPGRARKQQQQQQLRGGSRNGNSTTADRPGTLSAQLARTAVGRHTLAAARTLTRQARRAVRKARTNEFDIAQAAVGKHTSDQASMGLLAPSLQLTGEDEDEHATDILDQRRNRMQMSGARRRHKDPKVPPVYQNPTVLRQVVVQKKFRPIFVWVMFAINLIVFIVELGIGGVVSFSENPLLGPPASTLVSMGGLYRACMRGEYENGGYRFLTAIFLHVGILHFIANMAFFLRLGRALEKEYGILRIGIVYFVAGVCGNIFSGLFSSGGVTVGASGALYGLLAYQLVDLLMNWKLLLQPRRELGSTIAICIVSLLIGLLPYVDNFAHLGGFFSGMLISVVTCPKVLLGVKHEVAQMRLQRVIALVTLFILALGMLISFYQVNDPSVVCPNCKYLSCIPVSNWCDDPAPIIGYC